MPAARTILALGLVVGIAGACKKKKLGKNAWEEGPLPGNRQELQALGYIDYAETVADLAKSGVRIYQPRRVSRGIDLHSLAGGCGARLADVSGKVLHAWSLADCRIFRAVDLYPSGDLIAIAAKGEEKSPFMARLSWGGELLWRRNIDAHHDVEVQPDGGALILSTAKRDVPQYDEPILEEHLTYLDAKGEVAREISLWEVLANNGVGFELARVEKWRDWYDVTHANSVHTIRDPEVARHGPPLALGHVIVATRNQDAIFIIDVARQTLVWAFGVGELDGPHNATALTNGNILVFDNGRHRKWSRVVEIDPRRRQIVWDYRAKDGQSFFSRSRGWAQRLPNGNTLVVNSNSGQALEVTAEQEVVWEYHNPVTNKEGKRAVIVRLTRLNAPWLERRLRVGSP